jgi:adenine deaminase
MDPHEIANVLGIEGVRFMLENAKKTPLRQFILAPSCVPSVPGTEDSGTNFSEHEIAELLDLPDVIGIAEIMNFLDTCTGEGKMSRIIEEGLKRDMYLQGHAPRLSGNTLAAYLLAGPESDHECRSAQECANKVRLGMHVNLKTSSLSNPLPEAMKGIKSFRWYDSISLCTDDVHAGLIFSEGHLNRVVGKAIECGADSLDAIRFASYNAAREYKFDDLGAIAPGYVADLQLVDCLDGRRPSHVFCKGKLVAENGDYLGPSYDGQTLFTNTMKLPYLNNCDDLGLAVPPDAEETLVVYSKYDGSFNKAFYEKLPIIDGYVSIEHDPDIALACVCNRYGKRQMTIVPIRNFGITRGAIASTVSHDCHNLTMIYRDPFDAWLAAKSLENSGGGIVIVDGGIITASLALPVAGLMSDLPIEKLAPRRAKAEQAVAELCNGRSSLLKIATLALAALPGAIITDKGILEGETQKFMPPFK